MKHPLDITTWNRKEHYHFFKKFEEPFFGVTVAVDCTKAYRIAKEKNLSFFLYYLYKSLVAVNAIEPFKYRISADEIIVWDTVNTSPTINRPDGTFGLPIWIIMKMKPLFLRLQKKKLSVYKTAPALCLQLQGKM